MEIAWEVPCSATAYISPVAIGRRFWGFSQAESGHLKRLDPATGAKDWRGPSRQGDHASLVAARDRLPVFTEAGRPKALEATARRSSVVADHEVTTSAQWAHPAVLSSDILVKGQSELSLWLLPGSG